jgi:hypothetical protein
MFGSREEPMNLLALALLLLPQVPQPDEMKVDRAIRKGVDYLKGAASPSVGSKTWYVPDSDELILLTLVSADVPEDDPVVQKYLEKSLKGDLVRTYKVVLQAMALEEIDPAKYQPRIAQCAQFLVDNQCRNGQWAYGIPTELRDYGNMGTATTGSSRKVFGNKNRPKVSRKIKITPTRMLDREGGDNSNSQYAALGLRACHDAGVEVPSAIIKRASHWWATSIVAEKSDGRVATGGFSSTPGAWGYRPNLCATPYASMTAGATGALVIYDYIQGRNWRRNRYVLAGMAWITRNYSVTANNGGNSHGGGGPTGWLYYYLYALERLGMLYDTKTFGAHDWHAEGAEEILKAQASDGSWNKSSGSNATWDTCFAILFLKKATRPLVISTDTRKKKEEEKPEE